MTTDKPRITHIEQSPGKLLWAINRIPTWMFKLGLGGLLGDRFAMVVHRGRKTGRMNTVIVEVANGSHADGRIVVVCAYGERAQWWQNLKHSPTVKLEIGGKTYMAPRHEFLQKKDTEEAIASYWRRYPKFGEMLAGNSVFFYPGPVSDHPFAPTSLAFYLEKT